MAVDIVKLGAVFIVSLMLVPQAFTQTPNVFEHRKFVGPNHVFVKSVSAKGELLTERGLRVLLIGIHATRHLSENADADSLKSELEQLVQDKWVRLEYDQTPVNLYGDPVAYAFVVQSGGKENFVNQDLIFKGLSPALIIPPNVKYAKQLVDAEEKAAFLRKGIWKVFAFQGTLVTLRYERELIGSLSFEHPGIRLATGDVFALIDEQGKPFALKNKPGSEIKVSGRIRQGPVAYGPPPPYIVVFPELSN